MFLKNSCNVVIFIGMSSNVVFVACYFDEKLTINENKKPLYEGVTVKSLIAKRLSTLDELLSKI